MRWAGHVERMVDRKGLYRVLREKDRLENRKPRRKYEDNIKVEV